MELTDLYVVVVFIFFVLLITIIDRISKRSEKILIGCKVHYGTNMVIVLYYNKIKKKYYEIRYDINLWPIKKDKPIRFALYLDGFLVEDPELRKHVINYIKTNPPC